MLLKILNIFFKLFDRHSELNYLKINKKQITSKNLAASTRACKLSSVTFVSPQYMNSINDLSTLNFMSLRTIIGWLPNSRCKLQSLIRCCILI